MAMRLSVQQQKRLRRASPTVHSKLKDSNKTTASLLGITFFSRSLLCSLLLLVLVSLGSSRSGQGLFEDLQDLFIIDLLVCLEF
jgi:hypothetical protein